MKKSFILASLLIAGLLMTAARTAPGTRGIDIRASHARVSGTVGANMRVSGTLTPEERKFAVDYYLKTKARLLADVKGLSAAQLNFKADTSRWSVYQCTEHIALAETLIWQWIQMTEHSPATPDKRSEVKLTTEELVKATTDRSHKFQAPEMLKPGSQFADEQAALDAFVLRRDSTIAYIQSTNDDLKDHFITHPVFGTMDLYQGLVLLAAHTARHTLQLEEVKADPNFPKQ